MLDLFCEIFVIYSSSVQPRAMRKLIPSKRLDVFSILSGELPNNMASALKIMTLFFVQGKPSINIIIFT